MVLGRVDWGNPTLRSMIKEFREFIARGNVMELAVGLVIGAAFAKIVDSFVKDIMMPPIAMLTGGVDFSSKFIDLSGGDYATLADAQRAGAPTINYGAFLMTLIQFLIVAFAIFLVIRQYNRMRKPAAVTTKECAYCRSAVPLAATRCPNCTSELLVASS